MSKKPKVTKEAAEDYAACISPGKYLTWAVFATTFGVAYLAQHTYMYKTKKFLKKNRALRPLGLAGFTSYFFFLKVLIDCRKEIGKSHPECFEKKYSSKTTFPKSKSSSDAEFDET